MWRSYFGKRPWMCKGWCTFNISLSSLTGVMVSVPAIRPKVHGIIPGRGDGFLRAIKISCTPSMEGEGKLSPSCHKILLYVKNSFKVWRWLRHKAKVIIHFVRLSSLLPDGSAGRIIWELCWMNQLFSSVNIIPPWFFMLIYHMGMNNKSVNGLSSEM
jgi:hypothetical protein